MCNVVLQPQFICENEIDEKYTINGKSDELAGARKESIVFCSNERFTSEGGGSAFEFDLIRKYWSIMSGFSLTNIITDTLYCSLLHVFPVHSMFTKHDWPQRYIIIDCEYVH